MAPSKTPAKTVLSPLNAVDEKLATARALRRAALSRSLLVEAAEYTDQLNDLLDERLEIVGKAAV